MEKKRGLGENPADFIDNPLLKRAKILAQAGYSVIPVHGNNLPNEPKKPAIRWRPYQHRISSEAEIKRLFGPEPGALGIVCGRVSKLMVIDFDDHLRYQRFCQHLPQYAKTYTVKTRRGYHLYFRSEEKVPSHQFEGGDIKGERSYVIAPPSRIENFLYRAINSQTPIAINKADIDRLLNYFHVDASTHLVPGKIIREKRDLDLAGLYWRLVPEIGRNNALYRAASVARDFGFSKHDVEQTLLPLHIKAPTKPGHKYETLRDRFLEGQRTLESAFKMTASTKSAESGLPNSVRERLLQGQQSTVVARLLDILKLAGWLPGAFFTLSEAISVAGRYRLNRKSVLQALTGEHCTFNGRHIIGRRYVEYLDIRGLKRKKRGRPLELMFQVPSVSRLLSLLNVRWTPSDPIKMEDLKSARAYRLAVHREYIRRLSPKVSMALLARRLGVNVKTIQRYNRRLGVSVSVTIGRFRLTKENLRSLPKRRDGVKKNATDGYWLENPDGSCYPAWRHIGFHLLKNHKHPVYVCMRRPSRYSLGAGPAPSVEYERMSPAEFVYVCAMRGEKSGDQGVLARARDFWEAFKKRASIVRYEKVQLFFDTVVKQIPNDKVAETINGYLYAYDDTGEQVRRPAKRGVAFKMLKQFGSGNVFLALRDSYTELFYNLAGHALRGGDVANGMDLLARALG